MFPLVEEQSWIQARFGPCSISRASSQIPGKKFTQRAGTVRAPGVMKCPGTDWCSHCHWTLSHSRPPLNTSYWLWEEGLLQAWRGITNTTHWLLPGAHECLHLGAFPILPMGSIHGNTENINLVFKYCNILSSLKNHSEISRKIFHRAQQERTILPPKFTKFMRRWRELKLKSKWGSISTSSEKTGILGNTLKHRKTWEER